MKSAIFAIAFALVSSQAFAGATNEVINCSSADKKVVLTGDVPGDIGEFHLDVKLATKGPQELKMYSETNQTTGNTDENAHIVNVDDLRNGVFMFQADLLPDQNSNGATVKLYALPKTISLKALPSAGLKSSFKARIQVYGDNVDADTTVTCTTVYQI